MKYTRLGAFAASAAIVLSACSSGSTASESPWIPAPIEEVEAHAKDMLGNTLVTIQTGEAGKQVNRLYIEEGSDIDKEFYLSLLVDRATSRISFVVSTEGGMSIEDVAHDTPEKIVSFTVDPATGMNVYVMNGRFGAYVQLGETPEGKKADKPKRASLQAGMTESTVTLDEAFKAANDVLHGAVAGIAEIISNPGLINVDFADVRTVMAEMGMAMMGSAKAAGPDRARAAAA